METRPPEGLQRGLPGLTSGPKGFYGADAKTGPALFGPPCLSRAPQAGKPAVQWPSFKIWGSGLVKEEVRFLEDGW